MSAKMFVEDEVGFLKTAGLFRPGIESYLAQSWPPEVSLFFDSFDIVEAQREHNGLVNILERNGVEVIDLRKALASTLKPPKLSAEKLVDMLVEKTPTDLKGVPDAELVRKLLHQEALELGEDKAVALNEALSLTPGIPMGNIYFARDQSNVIHGTCLLSNMKYGIRQPEVQMIRKTLEALGYSGFYQLTKGTFEGGDAILFNGNVYIGSGARTSPEAIKQAADYFGSLPVHMVKIPTNGDWKHDMEIMHLDTFWMPVDYEKVLGCYCVLEKSKVIDIRSGAETGFLDHLDSRGIEVLAVPHEEQKTFGPNVEVIAPGKVIIPSSYNTQTTQLLLGQGIDVIDARLKELTKGVGATHCMILQLQKYRHN